jgi:hypothetical protein
VVDHVLEGLSLDRDPEVWHVREIGLTQLPRLVPLREVGLFGWTFQRPPHLDPTLQGTQLTVGEYPWLLTLQVVEQRLGLQAGTPSVLGLYLAG